MSAAFTVQPLLHWSLKSKTTLSQRDTTFYLNYAAGVPFAGGRKLTSWCRETRAPAAAIRVRASSTETAVVEEAQVSDDVVFRESYNLERTARVEGKITVRLEKGNDEGSWQLSVGCSLPGKWLLHWGVTYFGDVGSEWDQPPPEMIPAGSVRVKDYAIESPLEKSTQKEGEDFYEVKIDFNTNSSIASINFVLKDEVSGSWHQHRGRDFKIPLTGAKKGAFGQLSNTLLKSEESGTEEQNQKSELEAQGETTDLLEGFYEEHSIVKETRTKNIVNVFVKQNQETAKNILSIETDLPGDVVVHWGVCNSESRKWELPQQPYPSDTVVFRDKALRTPLKRKEGLSKSSGSFALDVGHTGFVFVLKLQDNSWLNLMGKDFFIPLLSPVIVDSQSEPVELSQMTETDTVQSNDIIREIRSLVSGISLKKNRTLETKEAQEVILQEIEKLAAEAYSIFRGSVPGFEGDTALEVIEPAKVISGIGTGFEVVCQGFNWESNKSGKWYMELYERAAELASLGFTVIWLPPPTDSVSPEGYMPRDLYNLDSRYGTMDELKTVVKRFHEVGMKVLGDAVLNHRCAQHQNQNGVWNIFGGRLNWDDRAVVADDPHFQGRGNKSSGDNFHAAPNIDHSQEFVRKDIKEWLLWMRSEIGYDGWRLDFVRGFWGGYVKDYLEATEPYFAVGEFWDSLSYTYGEMDHNQDAHRQRIVDWISATGGTASAFDVTTKGILHATLERCEYWRLSDEKGKPPGVVGWWPSRAITFIENHDTGSTQGHWRFPGGKEMQGYAYILTHPGTPSVFFDHIFSDFGSEIATLISLRNRKMINCRSTLKIVKAERDVYAAIIDDKVAMKIGPGHFEPDGNWSFVTEGRDYKVWETS